MEREEIERVERELDEVLRLVQPEALKKGNLWGDEGRDNGNTYEKTGQRTGF